MMIPRPVPALLLLAIVTCSCGAATGLDALSSTGEVPTERRVDGGLRDWIDAAVLQNADASADPLSNVDANAGPQQDDPMAPCRVADDVFHYEITGQPGQYTPEVKTLTDRDPEAFWVGGGGGPNDVVVHAARGGPDGKIADIGLSFDSSQPLQTYVLPKVGPLSALAFEVDGDGSPLVDGSYTIVELTVTARDADGPKLASVALWFDARSGSQTSSMRARGCVRYTGDVPR